MANPTVYDETDFSSAPGGLPDLEQLREEFEDATFSSTPVTLSYITSQNGGSTIDVQVYFSGIPDATDTTTADALIASHDASGVTKYCPPLYALLEDVVEYDWGSVSGAIEIDFNKSLNQTLTLTGTLSSGNITFLTPVTGCKTLKLKIVQDGTGSRGIPANAWPGASELDWGSKGAPTFADAADKARFVVLDFRGDKVYGHYDTNVFG